jgi:hypothetical protein
MGKEPQPVDILFTRDLLICWGQRMFLCFASELRVQGYSETMSRIMTPWRAINPRLQGRKKQRLLSESKVKPKVTTSSCHGRVQWPTLLIGETRLSMAAKRTAYGGCVTWNGNCHETCPEGWPIEYTALPGPLSPECAILTYNQIP